MDNQQLQAIVPLLLDWYNKNKRSLPWRKTRDPYAIWVSEIMLQQTRVTAALPYYTRFLQTLPTISHLANAEESVLLKLWEGLGYYSRVRNMQKAAKEICMKHGGIFPSKYDNILALPGIGEYTAGAIASIAFEQCIAAVDGNVLRVISRILNSFDDISQSKCKKNLKNTLEAIYPEDRAGDFTQSLMELGALICLPGKAVQCNNCPLSEICLAKQCNTAEQLPVKAEKKAKKLQKKTVLILSYNDQYALSKREEKGVLHGFYIFPMIDGHIKQCDLKAILANMGIQPKSIEKWLSNRHIFTHIIWEMDSFLIRCKFSTDNFMWKTKNEIKEEISIPSAFQPFLKNSP